MNRLSEITPVFVETIESEIEEGKLYISEKYGCAIHLCACGCKGKSVTPIGKGEWILTKNEDKVTLHPSIGNWSGERKVAVNGVLESDYHAHYFIVENKINWC